MLARRKCEALFYYHVCITHLVPDVDFADNGILLRLYIVAIVASHGSDPLLKQSSCSNPSVGESIMESSTAISGSERKRPDDSKQIGPLGADEKISVTLLIRPAADSPPMPDLAYWQNTPLKERHYLSPNEHAQIYGASQSDLDMVQAFIESHGMTVLDSHVGRRNVTIQGTAKQMEAAFGVKLNLYDSPLPRGRAKPGESDRHIHRGYDGPVNLPENLQDIVTAVIGLDNRRISGPLTPSGDPSPTNALPVPTLASFYNFPNAGASDQTIGIIELDGAGYLATDFTNLYFPSLPPEYQKPPKLNTIPLKVSGVIVTNNSSSPDPETCVDISVSGAIAQGVNLNVYFSDDTEEGWRVFLHRVLFPEGEIQPTVITMSYQLRQGDDEIGSLSTTGTIAFVLHHLFRELALQGISVFAACGDHGADNTLGSPHVLYPGSDPWLTSCGGTMLGNVKLGPPLTFDDWVWSDGFWSTGGGSSAIFPIPPYQKAVGIKQIKDSAGTSYHNRFVPDVSGMNFMTGFFLNGSPQGPIGGTSLVAPLYAGLTAVLQSALGVRLGFLNPIFYKLRHHIFYDITHGNNDSGDGSAFFTAGIGYDACSGCGRIEGIKFLNALAKLLYHQRLHVVVDQHRYEFDEVKHLSSYPNAFTLVLEGFTPNAVGTNKPTLDGPFAALTGVVITVGPPTPENSAKVFTPQRISYTCSINFDISAIQTIANGGVFPAFGDPPIKERVGAKIDILGETLIAREAVFTLGSGGKEHEHTGKINGLIYNRFGDFEGFLLLTQNGKEEVFHNGGENVESLVRFAWEKRALISVFGGKYAHSLNSIILRSLPSP